MSESSQRAAYRDGLKKGTTVKLDHLMKLSSKDGDKYMHDLCGKYFHIDKRFFATAFWNRVAFRLWKRLQEKTNA